MTPEQINIEISRRALAGEKYQELFRELVHHPHSRWPDWCRCMGSTDARVQANAWSRIQDERFPKTSLGYILGMPRTPEWVLPLAVSEILSHDPDDLTLCWLLYNTARQNNAEFHRVVDIVKQRGRLTDHFDYICQPPPQSVQEAVGDLLVSA